MPFHRNLLQVSVLLLAAAVLASPSLAVGDLPKPATRVLLKVTGAIGVTNDGAAASFDREMLEALPQHRIETYTDWTHGLQVFEGPLLSDLLDRVGARGNTLHATALNDYAVDVPRSDARDHAVLLALRLNGEAMTVRDKGPIWLIYPSAQPKGAQPNPHNEKSVWQLRSLDVR